jgi:hypothetical protein
MCIEKARICTLTIAPNLKNLPHLQVYIIKYLSDQKILGAFAKLRKANIDFVIPVRLSARMEQMGSHGKDFHEI